MEQSRLVISTKLLAGRTVVRVYADERPDPTFEATEATLEDVYFAVMKGAIGRGAACGRRFGLDGGARHA